MNNNKSVPPYHAPWSIVVLLALSCEVSAQALPEAASATEQQYLDLLEQKQEEGGITAPDLIEPLTALGQYYYEQQDYERAAEMFARARTLMRVNTGLDTPQELPLFARQLAAVEAGGNLAEAWELEEGLLQLAQRNVGSLEAVPIFLAAARKRLDLWERYRTGEHPPEIELGCYYDRSRYVSGIMLRLPSIYSSADTHSDCAAGERGTVLVALLVEARSYQLFGVEALLRNDRYASAELWQLVTEVLRLSDGIARRLLTTSDPALAETMARLLAYEPKDSRSAIRRAEFLLQLADMNIVRTRQARRMNGFDVVREQYEQAWQALQAQGVAQATLDAMFAPALPVVLPAYATNPLARTPEAEATGYIDVAFEVTGKGTSRGVKILGTSADVPRSAIRELQRLLDLSSFRPRLVEGQVVASAPVTVRYYVNSGTPEPAEE